MRLAKVRVTNYRSILDSGDVELDGKTTCLVGMTGSGKTSFLRMVSGIDTAVAFSAGELPANSRTAGDFSGNRVPAGQICQLAAVFEVEESDRASMPGEYRGVDEIAVRRYLDGSVELTPKGANAPEIDIEGERRSIKSKLDGALASLRDCAGGGADLARHRDRLARLAAEMDGADFRSAGEADLAVDALRNAANSIPAGGALRKELAAAITGVTYEKDRIRDKVSRHPSRRLYDLVPKPAYLGPAFDLEGEIQLDEFIARPEKSDTFYGVAVAAGLTPGALGKIRNAGKAEIDRYLEEKSARLDGCMGRLWKKDAWEFKLAMDCDRLRLLVKDKTAGATMPVLAGSAGFQWRVAFLLKVSAMMAQNAGRSVVLLDNPATELHDDGKADVLRFLSGAASSGRLQIVYSTHERALVDPWRTDRIRIAELTKDGTKIRKATDISGHDLLRATRKNIGSPARYSLFGAPVTVFFEGVSDMNIVSAVNEYAERRSGSGPLLHKDSFSINATNGVSNAPGILLQHRELGLQLVIVVDSGTATENMKKKIDQASWDKHFVEVRQITHKDGDTEDLVHPELYHAAFKSAYAKILDRVPDLADVQSGCADKKRITQYDQWFKRRGKEFDKASVSRQMFKVLMNRSAGGLDQEWLSSTVKNFEALFGKIHSKIG